MPLQPTRRTALAIVDLGNTQARLVLSDGLPWLSIYGLPTDTTKAPHLFDLSISQALPTQLRALADVVESLTHASKGTAP